MSYAQQLQDFVDTIAHAHIESLLFVEDLHPTFQKDALPFRYAYCHAVALVTKKRTFLLFPQQTPSGKYTLLVTALQGQETFSSRLLIDQDVQDVRVMLGYDDLPAKILLRFPSRDVSLYVAEIYDTPTGDVRCTLQDEMIIVCDSDKDAGTFEGMLDNASCMRSR